MAEDDKLSEWRRMIQLGVKERLDFQVFQEDETIFQYIDDEIERLARVHSIRLRDKHELRREVFNSFRKMDILQELLEQDEITEIMINGRSQIFIERGGGLEQWPATFESQERLEDIVQQIVARANRIVNEANPIVDVRLPDGSRVNVVLPPIAIDGPVVTIRKFPLRAFTMEKLITLDSLSREVADFLVRLVRAGYNIFVSGGTGSGKTTFLNALSNAIPKEERVITIEDSAELQIQGVANLVRMEARNANVEGKHEVSIRNLIRSSLRMRPDRIILGEVRDGAALDMLQAMNTGHDGSLSTGHANSPADMVSRLETLVLIGMESMPLAAVRSQIASAIDIIVHLGRLRDKSRRVLSVVEVVGLENGEVSLSTLYEFHETGREVGGRVQGRLQGESSRLQHREKLSLSGVEIA